MEIKKFAYNELEKGYRGRRYGDGRRQIYDGECRSSALEAARGQVG